MDYTYEIMTAEPRHKMLTVKYSAADQDDYFKSFALEDWSESNILSTIQDFAPFVVSHWEYQSTAANTSPLVVGASGSFTANAHVDVVEIEQVPTDLAVLHRVKRDHLLQESDWVMFSDTPEATQEWLDYRQALRDVPALEGYPDNFTWPTKPV